jgi:iron-sulfur cluster repair protein YtfE (RIC family)
MHPHTQPLRDEHLALLPELSALRLAAEAVGTPAAGEHLERARRLLVRHLYPHMAAEDEVLYPTIDRLVGADATDTMRLDHEEIRRRTTRLEEALREDTTVQDAALRSELYGLDAIIRLHLMKEEQLYYPILDGALDDPGAAELVANLHEAERTHHREDRP